MLSHFREDLDRIVDGRLLAAEDFVDYRRGLLRETLAGDRVGSFLEKRLANALFENDTEYRYQGNFTRNGVNYRPDFTLQSPKVVIECFGAAGKEDYDEQAAGKREFWATMRNEGWTFLEFGLADLQRGEETFVHQLLQKLRAAGVEGQRLSEQDVWKRVRKRALDQFTGAMGAFIGQCRRRNLSPDELQSKVAENRTCSKHEATFLQVGYSVYVRYLRRLATERKDDFNGLIWRAVSSLEGGQSHFVRDVGREHGDLSRLRFVMVDEFQDFSEMFFRMVDGIRGFNGDARFFCVGDDWQAINGFAGSELRFFQRFEEYFGDIISRAIRTNYRSVGSVVEVGNTLMRGKGTAALPSRSDEGRLWLGDLDSFRPSAVEDDRGRDEVLVPAVLRIIRFMLDQGQDVTMLARTNTVHGFFRQENTLERLCRHIRSFFPREERSRIQVSTAHKYKGRENDSIIVLDAVRGRYPLIHPKWIFLRIFGEDPEKIEEEEQRLFYVALTRARDSLVILTDSTRESPHVKNIRGSLKNRSLRWDNLPPAPSATGEHLEIRVSGAYQVRDQLKAQNYTWDALGKYWRRAVPAQKFSPDSLHSQPWAAGCTIEVYSESGTLEYRFGPAGDGNSLARTTAWLARHLRKSFSPQIDG